jgi:hypothetical protein
MSVHTEWDRAADLRMSVFAPGDDIPDDYVADDDLAEPDRRLVLEGGSSAHVIDGTTDELLTLANDIRSKVTEGDRFVALLDELYDADVLTKAAWLTARRRLTDKDHR